MSKTMLVGTNQQILRVHFSIMKTFPVKSVFNCHFLDMKGMMSKKNHKVVINKPSETNNGQKEAFRAK